MISVTSAALQQIRQSAAQGGMQNQPLRIAIRTQDDGSFDYAMGFDEQRLPGDTFLNFDGVDLVVAVQSKAFADGMTIDYVELEPGRFEFIFLNPNDPTYVAPGD